MSDLQTFEASFQNGDFEVVPVGTLELLRKLLINTVIHAHHDSEENDCEALMEEAKKLGLRVPSPYDESSDESPAKWDGPNHLLPRVYP